MISIITSTHNRSGKLKECIESVQSQTFTDYEHIIVDDCSTDDTESVVKSYMSDERVKYVRLSSNYGCDTHPKNMGIAASTGEFISFLDDDCKYRPDHLQVLYNEITKSNVDVVYGDRMLFGDVQGMGIFHDFDPFLLLRRNYIDTSDVLIKRNVLFDVGGFDERYKKYIDWNLWVRLAKAGYKFKHVPLVITDYYVGKDTKSATPQDEKAFSVPAWDPMDCPIEVESCIHQIKDPKIAVFTITYDRILDTKVCIESMYKTAGYEFDHFIVDNHSTDGLADWLNSDEFVLLDKHPTSTHLDFNKDNKGISIASNQAIDHIMKTGGFDIIVKVDPDALFLTDGWLAKMVEIWKVNRMMILSPYVQGLLQNPGGAPREAYGVLKGETLGLTKHVGGIVTFADAKVYKDFRWDENQPLHGVQDLEFTTYARMNGYQCGYLENYFVSHGPNGTEDQHKRYPDYFERRQFEKSHAYGEKE